MIHGQISIFECLNIKDTFRIAVFEDLRATISSLPESPNKNFKYKHYTDLIYKVVFGETSIQLKNKYNIDKRKSLVSILSLEKKERLKEAELEVCILLEQGLGYQVIKEVILDLYEDCKSE